MTFNDIWEEIVRCRGNVITTKENTKFTYVVNENSIFIPKANWKITKSELEGAVEMLQNPSFAKNAAIFATMSSDELKKQVTIKEIYLS